MPNESTQDAGGVTVRLDPRHVAYLVELLTAESDRGRLFEDSVLEQGRELWDGEWPAERVAEAHYRSGLAEEVVRALLDSSRRAREGASQQS